MGMSESDACKDLRRLVDDLEKKLSRIELQREEQKTIADDQRTVLRRINSDYEILLNELQARNRELLVARDQAEHASNAKNVFLATMSHEIRTPLNTILGFCELLSETELSDEQHRYVDVLSNSADTLSLLVGDLMDITRIESGRFELQPVRFELHQIIERTVNGFMPQFEKKGLTLNYTIEKGLPRWVNGDAARIRQIIQNLLSNALKYTRDGGVSVFMKRTDDGQDPSIFTVRITVVDTGIGIPEEMKCKVFDLFTQSDHSLTREYGGIGLGLYVCRKLSELLHGEVSFDSTVGVGSSFHFDLPLEVLFAGNTPVLDGEDTLHKDYTPVSVLVADDSEDTRMLYELYLRNRVDKVQFAVNGLEALNVFPRVQPDIVLMDIEMPIMNGYEAVERIRAFELNDPRKRAVIIAVTAHAMPEIIERCLACGCDFTLTKPFKKQQLLDAMALGQGWL